MPVSLTFTIEDDGLVEGIRMALAAAGDFTPAMAAIAGLMESGTRQRFALGRDPEGKPWIPSQRAIEDGGKTLIDRGHLRDSIAGTHDATSAVVGTNLIYAAIHQKGGTIRAKPAAPGIDGSATKRALRTPFGPRASVKMPARPFLGFSQAEKDRILEILSDHLAATFGGRGASA